MPSIYEDAFFIKGLNIQLKEAFAQCCQGFLRSKLNLRSKHHHNNNSSSVINNNNNNIHKTWSNKHA